jgi:hypothetical protein
MTILSRPTLTDVYVTLDSFVPASDSAYVYGTSGEERCAHSDSWESLASDVSFIRVAQHQDEMFAVDVGSEHFTVALRSSKQLAEMWRRISRRRVYLDITGMDHKVWAPLLKSGLTLGLNVAVVYVEPGDYKFNPNPREGDIFDLSTRISGIAPLPGFAFLGEVDEQYVHLVPLLGFEGIRFKHIVEQMQPDNSRIIPIVGVPGFRPEYPFFTYDGNRPVLEETSAWSRVRYARANCPFSLFYVLDDIAASHPWATLKIALIGTKPHAVGAVLYALLGGRTVELIYDHPIRKPERTSGSARVLVYHVSSLTLSTAKT